MDLLSNLSMGFGIAFTPMNLLLCFTGVVYGTIIGVLPGIGPAVAISILIPLTFGMTPISAVIMLAGIYYGGAYGGSTTSILVNTPGESSSVVTCIDGYQMALQGRAKAALATSAIGSFIAGTVSTVFVMLLAIPISQLGLKFTPAEYFSLLLLALTMVSTLFAKAPLKGIFATLIGLFIGTIGMDTQTGQIRFAFGIMDLMEGIDFIVVAIGLFAISEVLTQAEIILETGAPARLSVAGGKWWTWLSWKDFKQSFLPYCRGTCLGFLVGVLPGAGATTASFFSYMIEKKSSKHPEMFGKGAIEGVAGPEACNNAAHNGALVPLLTLAIPGSATTAILLGAFIMYGLQPGPLLFVNNPDFVWAIIASMYIANFILVILNLPLINLFIKILDLPAALLYSLVLTFCTIGVYSIRFSVFDVYLVIIFGIIGYFMRKHDYPAAPLLLAVVLGDLIEMGLRRALILSNGDWSIFYTRPISLAFQITIVISLLYPFLKKYFQKMKQKEPIETVQIAMPGDIYISGRKNAEEVIATRKKKFSIDFDRLLAIFTIPAAIFLINMAYRAPQPSFTQIIGPAFLPIMILSAIIVCAIFIFISPSEEKKRSTPAADGAAAQPTWARLKKYKPGALILLGLIIYVLILEYLGFIIGTTLLIVWTAQILERGKWLRNVTVGLLFTLTVYYCFVYVFDVMLPAGILKW